MVKSLRDLLPHWQRGNDDWAKQHLKFWFGLSSWSVDQAASLMVGLEPRYCRQDVSSMLDGVEIRDDSSHCGEQQFLVRIRRLRDDFVIAARASGLVNETPEEWLKFAKSRGTDPEWQKLAIREGMLSQSELCTNQSSDESTSAGGSSPQEKKNARADISWRLADEIAMEMWKRGIGRITARTISSKVEAELRKRSILGKQGTVSAETIRRHDLKGWKFVPP